MAPTMGVHSDLTWRRALNCDGGGCVMIAVHGQTVLIGDSKSPGGPVLSYSAEEWQTFLTGAKNGDFDDIVYSRGPTTLA
jgi:hypothetical protein